MSGLLAPEARMGNDIARQFAHLPHDEAVQTIAAHIAKFWGPPMRATLVSLAERGDDSIDPLLADAAKRL